MRLEYSSPFWYWVTLLTCQIHYVCVMSGDQTITDTKQDFVDFIYRNDGATSSEIEKEFDVSSSTVRTYVHDIRSEYNVDTIKNEDGTYRVTDASIISTDDEDERERELSKVSTRTITEGLKKFFKVEEKRLLNELNKKASKDVNHNISDDGKDIILSLGDIHAGESYEPNFIEEDGEREYNKEMSSRVPLKFYEKVKPKLESEDNIDSIKLCLLGDLVDGRAIYPAQQDHQDTQATMRKQIDWITLPLWNLIQYLETHADTVQVNCVKGNHGEIRLKGSSGEANLDLFVYDRLKLLLRGSDIDSSVEINTNNSKKNIFDLRNGKYRGFITHGAKAKLHAYGTSSSQSSWSNWQDKWDFDIAFRGHYHQYRLESVKNKYPVIMSPSPAPGGLFADDIGLPDFDNQYKLGTMTVFDDDGYQYNRLVKTNELDTLDSEIVDYKVDNILD